MTDPVVARLHRCLIDAVRRRGGDPRRASFKVSEVYEELVPYREVRRVLGVQLKADYEHALLRLLAGEGGLLRVEPEAARVELRQEAGTPYPFVGLYRKFAASDVWIMRDAVDAPDDVPASAVVANEHAETFPERFSPPPSPSMLERAPTFPEPAASAHARGRRDVLRPDRAVSAAGAGSERRVVARAAECAFCDQPLPVGRRLRYCPSCGSDLRLRPCPRCDEVLERTWRFCVNCGLEVPVVPTPRPPDPDE